MRRSVALALAALALAALASGCALVPQNRRGRLADRLMHFDEDALEAHKNAKFYSTRTGAAGGDGFSAGGGCGCQ